MSALHCRYCEGQFNSIGAFDAHLIPHRAAENLPWPQPYCEGEKAGAPVIDPEVILVRERMARLRDQRTL